MPLDWFLLHIYEYAEVYSVVLAWLVIPLVVLAFTMGLKRYFGTDSDVAGSGDSGGQG